MTTNHEPTAEDLKCKYCNTPLTTDNFYFVYRLLVITARDIHFVGITKLLEELANYCDSRYFHLSASEIVLLRPDVMKIFLEEKYKESIRSWMLEEYEICTHCYVELDKLIPLR